MDEFGYVCGVVGSEFVCASDFDHGSGFSSGGCFLSVDDLWYVLFFEEEGHVFSCVWFSLSVVFCLLVCVFDV